MHANVAMPEKFHKKEVPLVLSTSKHVFFFFDVPLNSH